MSDLRVRLPRGAGVFAMLPLAAMLLVGCATSEPDIQWTSPRAATSPQVTADQQHMDAALSQALEKDWQGEPCREYQTTVTIDGKTETAYGRACRQADGTWKRVPPEQEVAAEGQPVGVFKDDTIYHPGPSVGVGVGVGSGGYYGGWGTYGSPFFFGAGVGRGGGGFGYGVGF